jgi:hypothetical protein
VDENRIKRGTQKDGNKAEAKYLLLTWDGTKTEEKSIGEMNE